MAEKPLSKFTDKEWRGTIIAMSFIGVFLLGLGIYDVNWDLIKLGALLTIIGILGGFVLHYFFGIKIISIRKDFKHKN